MQVEAALGGVGEPAKVAPAASAPSPVPIEAARPPKAAKPSRSDALTLLASLQAEARLVDFIQESLEGHPDATIGAAARDVHRGCKAVLDRMFQLEPITEEQDGAEVEVPEGFDPLRYHLVGNVTGQPPYEGQLVHPGWKATKCQLPQWSGSDSAMYWIAPIEVELK